MAVDIKIKKAKVKSVSKIHEPLQLQHGTFYRYVVEMDNGDKGEYLSKSEDQDKFVVGADTDYEYHINPTYPNNPKIKVHYVQKSGGGFSGGGSKGGYSDEDKERMARSVAIKTSGIVHQSRNTHNKDIIADAEVFYNYIVNGVVDGAVNSVKNNDNGDLPF